MSQKAYEDACTRAELFGQPLPDKNEFLENHKHLDVVEFEEVEIRTAEDTAMLEETLKEASGGLAELNTLLTSTQTKINKLKGVCGSLTNFFRVKLNAKDNLSYSSEPSYVGQTNYDKDYVPPTNTEVGSLNEGLGPNDNEMTPRAGKSQNGGTGRTGGTGGNGGTGGTGGVGGMSGALDDLDTMQKTEDASLFGKGAMTDVTDKVTSQISKLDRIILQADKAQTSLQSQNKDMRKFLR